MKIRHGVLALLLSATCVNQPDEATESAKSASASCLPRSPPPGAASASATSPDGRYAQALAFDEPAGGGVCSAG